MKVLPVFLHIPRTGGTSLRYFLEGQLKPYQILSVYGDDILYPGQVLRAADVDSLEVVRGHFTFGVHKHLDAPCAYFTILREPVSRCLSLYKYIRRDPSHWAHANTAKMDFRQFLESAITQETSNGMVRQLCASQGPLPQAAYGIQSVPYGSHPPALLQEALKNIHESFMVVGYLDRYPEFIDSLVTAFGWRRAKVPRTNKTSLQLTVDKLDARTLALAKELNQLDTTLYERVRREGWGQL